MCVLTILCCGTVYSPVADWLVQVSELRVQEAQQRLSVCELRAVEQSRLVDELTTKACHTCTAIQSITTVYTHDMGCRN